MRAWKAVLLINLALVVGAGWGYAFWGLRAARLERELARARAEASSGVEREWTVDGVVRAVFPELGVLVLTHGDIPGFMPAMTMGFRTASPKIQDAVSVGDAVRFTLRGVPPNVAVTTIEKIK
ncbi:MAG TPA: copper-binding protein [Candidatus Binatia bacterium]|nr:copper-binding protein [Candidatus Binatia bacterium]